MPMLHSGLAKLAEELGELQQVVGKMLQYPDTDDHPDGNGSLRGRMEEEMADVRAAMTFVERKLGLRAINITIRAAKKLVLFFQWDKE